MPFPSPGDLPSPGTGPGLLHCRQVLYRLSYQGSPTRDWIPSLIPSPHPSFLSAAFDAVSHSLYLVTRLWRDHTPQAIPSPLCAGASSSLTLKLWRARAQGLVLLFIPSSLAPEGISPRLLGSRKLAVSQRFACWECLGTNACEGVRDAGSAEREVEL